MADPKIPQHLIDLQRVENAAWAALTAYRLQVGKTGVEWTDDEREEWARLEAVRDAAAEARYAAVRALIDALPDGETHDAFTFQRALHVAAVAEDAPADA